MIRYFYDKNAAALIRLDEEKMIFEQLPELGSPLNALSPEDMGENIPAPANASTERAEMHTEATPKRKPGCDECGSGGRHKSTCSRAPAPNNSERYQSGPRKPLKRSPCAECTSKGTRHKKDCSKAGRPQALTGNDEWARLEEQEAPKRPAMSQMIFGRVKISQQNDIPVGVIARNLDLAPEEIEKAFEVDTYAEYQAEAQFNLG
jgi:hypothetical protein